MSSNPNPFRGPFDKPFPKPVSPQLEQADTKPPQPPVSRGLYNFIALCFLTVCICFCIAAVGLVNAKVEIGVLQAVLGGCECQLPVK